MEDYYVRQAGSGIAGYGGVRYQKGNGFFGRLISGGLLPIIKSFLPYFGKKVLTAGTNIAEDMLDGKNFKSSVKSNLNNTARTMAKDAIKKTREAVQLGDGMRKRKAKKSLKSKAIKARKSVLKKRKTKKSCLKDLKKRTVSFDFLD